MLRFSNETNIRFFRSLALIVIAIVFAGVAAKAQRAKGGDEESPTLHEYKGISIGMLADDVRKKLGNPSDKGDEQDFFVFNDNETAQVLYDKTHKVMALSFDFMSGAKEVPTVKTVFGADVAAKPDGSIYKMVRYPKAGYWLSYNRTGGATPMTSITFQRIEH